MDQDNDQLLQDLEATTVKMEAILDQFAQQNGEIKELLDQDDVDDQIPQDLGATSTETQALLKQLAQQNPEIKKLLAQQNEELAQQKEQIAQQNEELAQENEELKKQLDPEHLEAFNRKINERNEAQKQNRAAGKSHTGTQHQISSFGHDGK